MKHSPLTRHHLLAQAWGGQWHPNNIINIQEHTHQAFHTVFQCDTPIQQHRRLLETTKKAMKPEAYKAISDVLKRFEGTMEVEIYEPEVIDTDIFLQRLGI